jgi:outer membrane lipoprotein-sorting protein
VRIGPTFALLSALLASPLSAGAQAPARPAGAPPDPFAVLESAGLDYQKRSAGLCADFRQTLTVPLLGEARSGRGRLCSRPPGYFAMRFSEPAGDLLVADGTWFWAYTPSTDRKQVIKWRLNQGPRGVDFYREFLDQPRKKYRAEYKGRETVDGKATHRIVVTPLAAAPYRSADLWIDVNGAALRQIQIREENGSVRTVTLGATGAPTASAFTFTPPAGTQVFTR